MKIIKIAILLLILIMSNALVYADSSNDIKLDGSFEDWVDKPSVADPKHDIETTWMDFLQVGYFTDNEYLYLQVERLSAEKSEPWEFTVVMLNATEGRKHTFYPFDDTPVKAAKFDIEVYYDGKRSQDGTIVDVLFEGDVLESTLSSDSDAKMIEFRVPLVEVGLDGLNKEVEFMLKSEEEDGEVDWVPDGRPIIVTTGPTLYQLSIVVCFGGVAFLAYGTLKKRRI